MEGPLIVALLVVQETMCGRQNGPVVDQSSATKVSIAEYSIGRNVADRGSPLDLIPHGVVPTHDATIEGRHPDWGQGQARKNNGKN